MSYYCLAQPDFKHAILLPPQLEHWDYKWAVLCPTPIIIFLPGRKLSFATQGIKIIEWEDDVFISNNIDTTQEYPTHHKFSNDMNFLPFSHILKMYTYPFPTYQ